jgi:uncharacterized hydrophobic protein (TIGR00341 family)
MVEAGRGRPDDRHAMPLRLIEMVLPAAPDAGLDLHLAEEDVLDRWRTDLSDGRCAIRYLVEQGKAERVLDALQERHAGEPGFRIVLLDVGLTLPAIAEPTPPAAVEIESQPAEPRFGRVSRQELQSDLSAAVDPRFEFYVLVVLSTIVAAVGLMRDSSAAVIAAMVIAPLLGPNMALALATTISDAVLVRTALRRNFEGVAIATALSLSIGVVVAVSGAGQGLLGSGEIQSRVAGLHPGDFVLALASGIAGTLSFTTGAPATLIGVMVAVARMPPLVCTGLLFGCGEFDRASSALLLLITNVICVNLAAVGTFRALGVAPSRWWEAERAGRATRRALAFWSVALAALAIVTLIRFGRG